MWVGKVSLLFVAPLYVVDARKTNFVHPFLPFGSHFEVPTSHKPCCKSVSCWNTHLRGGSSNEELYSKMSDDTNQYDKDHFTSNLQIESILKPRSFSALRMIRVCLFSVVLHFLFECFSTIGQPYRQALQELGFILPQGHDKNTVISPVVELLSHYVAAGSGGKIVLPPMHLPSFAALTGFIAATALLTLSLSIPVWNKRLDAWANYEVIVDSNNRGEEGTKVHMRQVEQVLVDQYRYDSAHQMPVAALVKIICSTAPTNHSSEVTWDTFSTTSHFMILPLLSTIETESMKDYGFELPQKDLQGHPQLWYVEHEHQRIYVNPHTLQCFYGGPTFYRTIPLSHLVNETSLTPLSWLQERYGPYNYITLSYPTIESVLKERFTSSPLVMIQLASSLLHALEDEARHAALSLLTKLLQYYLAAQRVVVQSKQLAKDIEMQEDSLGKVIVKVLRYQNDTRKISAPGWVDVTIKEVFPGDIFCFPIPHDHSQNSASALNAIPIDALLLEGTVICNEAVLTGESVPQCKVPILPSDFNANSTDVLDMFGRHRSSVLFAGAAIVHACNDDRDNIDEMNCTGSAMTPQGFVRCLALRTGSYSSRGEIIRTLHENPTTLGSDPRIERDGLRSILVLSFFAIVTCASLFFDLGKIDVIPQTLSSSSSLERRGRNQLSSFRRIIMCTRIVTASIPTNLPLFFSGVVSACAERLKAMDDVVCSSPFSLIDASMIDLVVLDKTGTITADTERMTEVVKCNDASYQNSAMIEVVLSGCHSVVVLQQHASTGDQNSTTALENFVGDPLDIAALRFSSWVYDGKEQAACRKTTKKLVVTKNDTEENVVSSAFPIKLWRLRTFPFDPNRRMSSAVLLVLYDNEELRLCKVAKGHPDVMKGSCRPEDLNELSSFHDWFDEKCQLLGDEGKRIVATGYCDVTSLYAKILFPDGFPVSLVDRTKGLHVPDDLIIQARLTANERLGRAEVEDFASAPLIFSGFACFSASIRGGSRSVVYGLKNSGIDVCMLTGDGINAAISVAMKTCVIDKEQAKKGIFVIDVVNGALHWKLLTPLPSKKAKKRPKKESTWSLFTQKSMENKIKSRCHVCLATGNAIELMMFEFSEKMEMKNILNRLSVIACATPKTKQQVIQAFKGHCNRRVLMCGKGVY